MNSSVGMTVTVKTNGAATVTLRLGRVRLDGTSQTGRDKSDWVGQTGRDESDWAG